MRSFSIIVPIYNSDIVWETLQSFFAMEYPRSNYEIILVDDGSDLKYKIKTQYLVQKYSNKLSIKYLYLGDKKQKMRVNLARNIWSRKASFDYLIFIDGDSLVPYYYLKHYNVFLENKRKDEILVWESIGYNYEDVSPINPQKILLKNYRYYLNLPKYSDFRRKWGYKNFWHVFLWWNFCITKKQIHSIWLWDDSITSWWEDDIEFSFRAYKKWYSFSFSKRIEIYNVADSERLTREKMYSVFQNQCYVYKKHNLDLDYYEYVAQRFANTRVEYKEDNLPSDFVETFFINSFYKDKADKTNILITIHLQIPDEKVYKVLEKIILKWFHINIVATNSILELEDLISLKKKYFFRISLNTTRYMNNILFIKMYKNIIYQKDLNSVSEALKYWLVRLKINQKDLGNISMSWWDGLSKLNSVYISLDEVQTYI